MAGMMLGMLLWLVVLIVALGAGTALAAPAMEAAPAGYDGLVAGQSRNLDRLYVRPNAQLARYQKVMIDPVTVEYSKEWLKNVNDPRYVVRVRPEDARRIADETTANVGGILADAFKARG